MDKELLYDILNGDKECILQLQKSILQLSSSESVQAIEDEFKVLMDLRTKQVRLLLESL